MFCESRWCVWISKSTIFSSWMFSTILDWYHGYFWSEISLRHQLERIVFLWCQSFWGVRSSSPISYRVLQIGLIVYESATAEYTQVCNSSNFFPSFQSLLCGHWHFLFTLHIRWLFHYLGHLSTLLKFLYFDTNPKKFNTTFIFP